MRKSATVGMMWYRLKALTSDHHLGEFGLRFLFEMRLDLLVKIEPLRPYFVIVTAAVLGAGFYFTYRKPKAAVGAEGEACACPAPKTNRLGKIMLWVATFVVVGFLAFPYLTPLFFG